MCMREDKRLAVSDAIKIQSLETPMLQGAGRIILFKTIRELKNCADMRQTTFDQEGHANYTVRTNPWRGPRACSEV
jgi:hypothetical protein